MDAQQLLMKINSAFSECGLESARTLLELDYQDSSYCYRALEQEPYANAAEREKEVERINSLSGWTADEKSMALHSLFSGLRMKNQYKHWQEVAGDYMERHFTGLYHLDSLGFRFYLAAFMRLYISESQDLMRGGLAITAWINSLLNPYGEDGEVIQFRTDRYELLNEEQRLVVAQFLQYLIESESGDSIEMDAAIKALRGYWRAA